MGNNLVVTDPDTDIILLNIEQLSPTTYRVVPARNNKHFQFGSVYETVIVCKGGCRGDRAYYGDNSVCDVRGRTFYCKCLDSSYEQIDGKCGASGSTLSVPVTTGGGRGLHYLQIGVHALVHGLMTYSIYELAGISN